MSLDALPVLRAVPSVTAAQMAEVDRLTIEELHMPLDALMENASRQVAAGARAFLGGVVGGKRVIGLIGSGNNGGDAAGALRHLSTGAPASPPRSRRPRSASAGRRAPSSAASDLPPPRRSPSSTMQRKARASSTPT